MQTSFLHYTQFDAMDCGPTCLRMIAKHYGRSYTLQSLCERSFIGDILQRIGDHGRIQDFLSGITLSTLFSFFNFFVFAGILAYYNLSILLVFIIGNALYVAWIMLFMRYRKKLGHKRFAQSSANQSNMVQLIRHRTTRH